MAYNTSQCDVPNTVYQVYIKNPEGKLIEVSDFEPVPKQVVLKIVSGEWKPVDPKGVDFLKKKFAGLFRDEESVFSFETIFDPDLGMLSFLVAEVDASEGVAIVNTRQYFLLPISKQK